MPYTLTHLRRDHTPARNYTTSTIHPLPPIHAETYASAAQALAALRAKRPDDDPDWRDRLDRDPWGVGLVWVITLPDGLDYARQDTEMSGYSIPDLRKSKTLAPLWAE